MKHVTHLGVLLLLLFAAAPVSGQERIALCELFTSTTCPPCAGANQAFDAWLSTYAKQQKVAIVKYHVWWPAPGNDPYYFANRTHASGRNTYYANNYAPHMFINGSDAGSSYSPWPGMIENELSKTPLVEIGISGSLSGSDVSATVSVKAGSTALPAGTLRLHVIVTESGLTYTGTNGDPNHEHVMRTMVTEVNGELLTIGAGQTVTSKKSITLDPSWVSANTRIVAFVQVQETKAVLQAVSRKVGELTSAPKHALLPADAELGQNFPNPFNPSTTIRYAVPASGRVTLTVYDLLGNVVAVLVDEHQSPGWKQAVWNADRSSSGVYFCRLSAGGTTRTQRMVLMK